MTSLKEIFEGETPEQRKKRLNKESQAHHRKKYKVSINLIDRQHTNIKHHELGRMDQICIHCGR